MIRLKCEKCGPGVAILKWLKRGKWDKRMQKVGGFCSTCRKFIKEVPKRTIDLSEVCGVYIQKEFVKEN